MMRSLIRSIIPALTGVMLASTAYAQSCNPIEMTPEEIKKTDAIFIGKVVTKDYDPAKVVNRPAGYRPVVVPPAPELDDEKKLKATYLIVTASWKGPKEEEMVKIWTDVAFAEEYELENEYLLGGVLKKEEAPVPAEGSAAADSAAKPTPAPAPAPKKPLTAMTPAAEYEVPLCGLSFHYPSFEQKRKHYNFYGEDQLEAIKAYFSEQESSE